MKILFRVLTVLIMGMVGVNAQAAKMNVKIDTVITNNADGSLDGIVNVGDALSVNIVVDTTNPDLNPSVYGYLSSAPSRIETVFLLLVGGPTNVSTTGTTLWSTNGYLDLNNALPGLYLPFSTKITGSGMTRNQIVPNFRYTTGGTIDVDAGSLNPGHHVLAKMTAMTVTVWGDADGDGIGNVADDDDDNDGIPDAWELTHGLNALLNDASNDPDGDGLLNSDEYALNTNPFAADSDSDGLNDASSDNCLINANSNQLDTDGDGQGDACDSDADEDGMPNTWETSYGLNSLVNDAAGDADSDGISNLDEFTNGTKPNKADTDADGVADATDNCPKNSNASQLNTDGDAQGDVCDSDADNDGMPNTWEKTYGLNPLVNDAAGDPDRDGVSNLNEFLKGTCPKASDSDGDFKKDAIDNCPSSWNYNQADMDHDGLGDVCDIDLDGDEMYNIWESFNHLNPNLNDGAADLDGDGVSNVDEFHAGTNPAAP